MAGLGSLDPIAIQQWFDNNGNPLNGGKLFFYLSGTDTPSPVYNDQALTIPLANPLVLDAAGRAPMHFLDALSYKEVLKNSGDVTIWTADPVVSPGALRNTQGSFNFTGNQNDVPVPPGLVTFLNFTGSAPVVISGFSGGTPGQMLILRASISQVDLLHANTASQAGNRLFNFSTSGPTSMVGTSGTAVYIYQPPYWILVTHEQGRWIRVPYVASNFNCPAPATWTVDNVDVTTLDFYLKGTNLLMTISLHNTTVAGGTPQQLFIHGWPYQFSTTVANLPATGHDGVTWAPAQASVGGGASSMSIAKIDFANWPIGVNNVYVYAQLNVPVN